MKGCLGGLQEDHRAAHDEQGEHDLDERDANDLHVVEEQRDDEKRSEKVYPVA